jgi:hypothetical protein
LAVGISHGPANSGEASDSTSSSNAMITYDALAGGRSGWIGGKTAWLANRWTCDLAGRSCLLPRRVARLMSAGW